MNRILNLTLTVCNAEKTGTGWIRCLLCRPSSSRKREEALDSSRWSDGQPKHVNGRAERDLSSPFSRGHLLKVPLDSSRWVEYVDFKRGESHFVDGGRKFIVLQSVGSRFRTPTTTRKVETPRSVTGRVSLLSPQTEMRRANQEPNSNWKQTLAGGVCSTFVIFSHTQNSLVT
jgi:hypothetical protein